LRVQSERDGEVVYLKKEIEKVETQFGEMMAICEGPVALQSLVVLHQLHMEP